MQALITAPALKTTARVANCAEIKATRQQSAARPSTAKKRRFLDVLMTALSGWAV